VFSDYNLKNIGGEYYIYVITTGKSADNYSMIIEDVSYMDGAVIKNDPIIGNFSITTNLADFSLTPGVVQTDVVFSVTIQNLQSKSINLVVNDGTNENYNLLSGEIMDLFFVVKSGIRTISFNSANQSYDLTVDNPVIAPECTTNEECELGKMCVNNSCITNTSWCTLNEECGIGKLCANNSCVVNSSWCINNSNCSSGKICLNNECVTNSTNSECATDEECADGTICIGGFCIDEESNFSCTIDEECELDEICINHNCVINESEECKTNDECEENKLCLDNKCVEIINCTKNKDCTNGTICREGICIENSTNFSCIIDEECSDDKICINNECSINWTSFVCKKDSECGEGRLCIDERCINEDDVIIIDDETGEVKTCAEMEGVICSPTSQMCEGEKRTSAEAECCLGKCINKTSNKSKKIVGWVLIIVIVLIFAWFFLKKYSKTKKKKVDLEKESKGKNLPPMPPPKMP
jgi:hypothetical protein